MEDSFFGAKSTSVFFGAGLSLASGLPIVGGSSGLTRAFLQSINMTEKEIEIVESARTPFETLMGNIRLGAEIDPFLDIFDVAEVNDAYAALSNAAGKGKITRFITTNFDRNLEASLDIAGVDYTVFTSVEKFLGPRSSRKDPIVEVVKLHGCISNRAELGITIDRVGKNYLLPEFERAIRMIFSGETGDRLVFLGYSGSDHFDILPAVRKLNNDPKKLREILFVNHSPLKNEPGPLPEFLSHFSGYCLNVDTDQFLRERLSTSNFKRSSTSTRSSWRKKLSTWASRNLESPHAISAGIFTSISEHAKADEKFLQASVGIDSKIQMFTMNVNRINTLTNAGLRSEAQAIVDEVALDCHSIRDFHLLAFAHLNMAVFFTFAGQDSEAIDCLKKARGFSRFDISSESEALRFRILANYSAALVKDLDFDTLGEIILELDEKFKDSGDLISRGIYLRSKASQLINSGRPKAALEALNEARQTAEKLALRDFEVACLFEISEILRDAGEFSEALSVDESSLRLAEKYGLVQQQGIASGNMGISLLNLGRMDEAGDALRAGQRMTSHNHKALIDGNYAVYLTRSGDLEAASIFLRTHIRELEGLDDNFSIDGLRRAYLNLADVCIRLEDNRGAAKAAKSSADLAKKLRNLPGYARALTNLAIANYNLDSEDSASRYASEALAIFNDLGPNFGAQVEFVTRFIERLHR